MGQRLWIEEKVQGGSRSWSPQAGLEPTWLHRVRRLRQEEQQLEG